MRYIGVLMESAPFSRGGWGLAEASSRSPNNAVLVGKSNDSKREPNQTFYLCLPERLQKMRLVRVSFFSGGPVRSLLDHERG
jgi:hypothetical protein